MFPENYMPTNEPCDVCGKIADNGVEPRFLYVICREHSHMSPVQVSEATRGKGK